MFKLILTLIFLYYNLLIIFIIYLFLLIFIKHKISNFFFLFFLKLKEIEIIIYNL